LAGRWTAEAVARRGKALQRGYDGRRKKDSKDMHWVVTIECTSKKIANKVISAIKVAELPPSLSTKVRGSIRKWRPDKDYGYEKREREETQAQWAHGGEDNGAGQAEYTTRQR
jgi:hypothetical protein